MTDTITITGTVGTEPRHLVTSAGLAITSFRLASTLRRFDRNQNRWVDGETNWYTVTTFRQLAFNTLASIKSGERVIVVGRLRLREWKANDKAGTNVDIEADAVGHDLSWGTTSLTRVIASSSGGGVDPSARPSDQGEGASTDDADGQSGADWAASPTPTPPSIAAATSFDDLVAGENAAREKVPF